MISLHRGSVLYVHATHKLFKIKQLQILMLEELCLHIGENAKQKHIGAKKQHIQHF
jgi:hypothetical protein